MKLLRRKNSNILISGIALVLLIAFLWSYNETGSTPNFKKTTKNPTEPDFFIIQTSSQSYDKQGLLNTSISSPELEHYPINDRTHLKEPVIKLYKKQQQTWQITANSGIVHQGGEQVNLKENVIIRSGDANGVHEYLLTTNALKILPDKKLIENNRPVKLITPQGSTTAIGLKADLNKEHLLLKKRVRGLYHAEP